MKKYTQQQLKRLVKSKMAVDVTNAQNRNAIPENYTQVGYSCGVNGCNGQLYQGDSGRMYAVTDRTLAIYVF